MTLQEMIEKVPELTPEEQAQLMDVLAEQLNKPTQSKSEPKSLLDFAGIGSSLYDGTDAQAYVNKMREEWDHRP